MLIAIEPNRVQTSSTGKFMMYISCVVCQMHCNEKLDKNLGPSIIGFLIIKSTEA